MQRMLVHEKHNEIRRRSANLIADAAAVDCHEHWRAPAITGAAGCDSAAIVSSKNEREFQLARYDRYALRFVQKIVRYALIRRAHDLVKNLCCLVSPRYVVFAVRSDRGHGR